MKIDEVIKSVYTMERECAMGARMRSPSRITDEGAACINKPFDRPTERPRLIIYMEYDYFHECMAEIPKGGIISDYFEFIDNNTIHGHPVFLAIAAHRGRKPSPFKIYAL